jgi:ABC-type dipeptide/oligopeptide/nickel transport system permease component
VNLLITFLITVTIGIFGAAWVGVLIDKMTSPFISLLIFFPLFFLTIWLTWRLSVKLTEPKATTQKLTTQS